VKRKYVSDYKIVAGEDDKERIEYNGALYHVDFPPDALAKAKARLLASAAAVLAFFLAMGIAGNYVTREVYVAIPYAMLIIPCVYAVVDSVRFIIRRGPMERVHYEGSFLHIREWAAAVMVLSATELIGFVVFFIRSADTAKAEWLFAPFTILLFLSAFILFKQCQSIKLVIRSVDKIFQKDYNAANTYSYEGEK
jgi:hypothetical protein